MAKQTPSPRVRTAVSLTTAFAEIGYGMVEELLSDGDCSAIGERLLAHTRTAGSRNLLQQDWCTALAQNLRRHPSITALLPHDATAVQCTFFQKSSSRNWLVPWHQDLSIPVKARVSAPELSGWSVKEDALYVHAPVYVLQELVAVRLHLDPCLDEDGPLRVIPASHLQGVLACDAPNASRFAQPEVRCTGPRGSALVMRPLLLHASSKSTGTGPRRVLHFVFGPAHLPYGLEWHTAV